MTTVEALIRNQLQRWERERNHQPTLEEPRACLPPIITVSRQTGSRGSYFASRLALRLDYQRIHREVVDAICTSDGYGKRILDSLTEQQRSDMETRVELAMSQGVIDQSEFTHQIYRIVLAMSLLGGVVLVGRGGNFILGPRHGLHLRFIAPRERRIRNLMAYKNMTMIEAEDMIDDSDRRRQEFVQKIFGADINDPSHYDMVINADCIDVEELVDSMVVAYRGKCDKLANLDNDIP